MASSLQSPANNHGLRTCCPFTRASQLNDELCDQNPLTNPCLPGYPRVKLENQTNVTNFLHHQLISRDLERMAPRLWWMSKQDSKSISPLHRQLVKKRNVVVTEDPKLHLTWLYDRIYIKPLPEYLMSYKFWAIYLAAEPDSDPQQQLLRKAALGYLRTYFFLIQHRSDFRIAQYEDLQLLPAHITWDQFCDFSSDLDKILDSDVTERYRYGEIRLTRLNFYAKILLQKWNYHRLEPQYAQYFAQFYGPILFVFGVLSVLLSAMQVEIAAEQFQSAQIWPSFQAACRGFSIATLVVLLGLILILICLLILKITNEWIFALRDRFWHKKGTVHRTTRATGEKPDYGHV